MRTGGIYVSEYSRRNRGQSSSNDDFDWEKFDRQTANRTPMSADDEPPLRRRRSNSHETPKNRIENERSDRRNVRQPSGSRVNSPTPSRKRKKKKRLTEEQKQFRRRVRLVILAIILVMVVVLSGMFVGMYAAVSREIKEMNIESLALNSNSTVYYIDENGREVEYSQLHSDNNCIWVESSEIAPCFKDAVVAIEDERFYKHNGVDIKRTLGATVKYVASKLGVGESSYGGSTITQQVIKNITAEDDFKATRKVKEIMRAIALENQLSKDEILTLYCNVCYFANGCNGVEAAARTYFNKSAIDLNIEEAASIAGITQFPSKYDPIANPESNVEKRNTVLGKMLELGKISSDEYDKAVSSALTLNKGYIRDRNTVTTYFEDQLVNDLISDLMERKNYTRDFAESQVYNGGFKIYATIDPKIQSIMNDVFENTSNFGGNGKSEAAMVILDPYTGEIKGLIGGLGKKTDTRGFNRATQAIRQPGSAIKPLAVYAPAVDLGKVTESDIVKDEEITVGNDNWKPKNSYSGFKGNMTVKEAVARSANIPAVKVLQEVGLSNSYGYLQNKFHISTLQDGDKNFSALALGGFTQGVTVKDMAAAYGVFVNSGKYITPYTYSKVLDAGGNVVLENYKNETQAISESAAYITADLLSGPVNLSMGTATRARLSSGMPAYGKTGTTDDDFDKWFVGFTPYYVGAVWFGFDTPSSLSAAGIKSNPCVTAWNLVFEKISASQPYKSLDKPSSVKEAKVCLVSGKLAGSTCDAVKSYFVSGTEPKQTCTNHYNTQETIEPDDDTETDVTDATATPSASGQPTKKPQSTAVPNGNTTTSGGNGTGTGGGTGSSAVDTPSGGTSAEVDPGTSGGGTASGATDTTGEITAE